MSATTDARPTGPDGAEGNPARSTSNRLLRSPAALSCLAMYGATSAGFGLAWIAFQARHQSGVVFWFLMIAHTCAILGLLWAAVDIFVTDRLKRPDPDDLLILIVSSILAECFILVVLWQPPRATHRSQAQALLGLLILCSIPCLLTIGPAIRRHAQLAAYSSACCFATYVAFLVLASGFYDQPPDYTKGIY